MSKKVSRQEFLAVNKLDTDKKYKYAIKTIADWEELYALIDAEENFATGIVDDHLILPIWPAEKFAELCQHGEWSNFSTVKFSVEEFQDLLEQWSDEHFLLSIMSTADKSGFVLSEAEFLRDLLQELQKYK